MRRLMRPVPASREEVFKRLLSGEPRVHKDVLVSMLTTGTDFTRWRRRKELRERKELRVFLRKLRNGELTE